MKWFVLLGALATVVGCAAEEQEPVDEGAQEQPLSASSKERWCNSYKTEQYCPKKVCVWHTGAKAYCGLPASE
ncbi:MAG TPA: hypothetical protein VM925_28515 [Labilithrix sp.]|nr:hypothetical protein [Labilithrix sp.]